jgi:hypothetical protein
MPDRRRGRPLKFGRPSQLLTITLPHNVISWLKRIHHDPAWAIVSLHDRLALRGPSSRPRPTPRVELARLTGRRALIVVDPSVYRSLPGVSVIPMAPGRAFLALESGRGVADLELTLLDRMEHRRTSVAERKALETLVGEVRGWRRSRAYRFSTRSIIVVEERRAGSEARP